MGNVLERRRGEPRPTASREARRAAMTAAYDALDSLIAELHQLRADNRRLNLELAAARSQRDSCSTVSPFEGFTGGALCW
jgi:YD repeat-containing protein